MTNDDGTRVLPVVLTPEQIAAHAAEIARLRALTGGELATEVMDLIEENRERWYQGAWRRDVDNRGNHLQPCDVETATMVEAFAEDPLNPACTTSFCYAGWVGAVKGVKWAKGNGEVIGNPDKCDCVGFCCTNTLHQMHISDFAREQLDISSYDGDKLFNGDNSIYELRSYTEEIVQYGEILSAEHDDSDEEDDDDDDE
jgi:hypothetical protein